MHADYPVKEPPAEMLRVGQNLRKVVSLGSIEPMARRSSSVDWSDEAVSGSNTDMDHLSLMDPFYDLTRARLTKLFNFFHPDGEALPAWLLSRLNRLTSVSHYDGSQRTVWSRTKAFVVDLRRWASRHRATHSLRAS